MVRVHSGLPLKSLNLLGWHWQFLSGLSRLVNISQQFPKSLHCLALMRGNGESVEIERGREFGVPELRLRVFQTSAHKLQEGCVSSSESVPTQPGCADLFSGGF